MESRFGRVQRRWTEDLGGVMFGARRRVASSRESTNALQWMSTMLGLLYAVIAKAPGAIVAYIAVPVACIGER